MVNIEGRGPEHILLPAPSQSVNATVPEGPVSLYVLSPYNLLTQYSGSAEE